MFYYAYVLIVYMPSPVIYTPASHDVRAQATETMPRKEKSPFTP